ncbi:RAMP superfamily CRISPR-associated protein [Desulfurispora thermophila]|uniref:RAMP superfamily CRISPR-associated protein n=1 Tax=Desulfurispora thermophila TaxID=265470 RepID=UPI0003653859|nr:RAMP superfamily CRISPR-associated protein [Desulfurispora thermophila]
MSNGRSQGGGNAGRQTLLKEKPYSFVPLNTQVERQRPVGHAQLCSNLYSGRLELQITCLTPVHIFSGLYSQHSQHGLYKVFARRGEKPVIPGSSIKGVVRSVAEAVSKSCAPRLPDNNNWLRGCLPEGNRQRCDDHGGQQAADRMELCPACRLFGHSSGQQGRRGQVAFSDFHLVGEPARQLDIITLPALSKPFEDYPPKKKRSKENNNVNQVYYPGGRIDIGNERLYYCRLCDEDCLSCSKSDFWQRLSSLPAREALNRPRLFRGRKFYYHSQQPEVGRNNSAAREKHEVARKDSVFQGQVVFHNLNREELSLLVFSLGLDGSFCLKIGYGKPAYLGSVQVELLKVENLLRRYGVPTPDQPPWDTLEAIQELARQYDQNGDEAIARAVTELRRILDWNNPRGPAWREVMISGQEMKIY